MADHLLSMGEKVIGIDSMTYASNIDNLKNALKHANFSFYKVDICQTDVISNICNKNNVNWIFNFAAETHVDNSIDSIDAFIHSNILGVNSLLQVCKNLKIKILHISTDEVYGSILEGSFSEKDPLNPTNPYSATKASAEHLILSYANTHNIKYLIFRPSNNFGPRQHEEKLLPTIVKSLVTNKNIPVYGDGSNIRDWLYVKDNVSIIFKIWKNSIQDEIYNISLSQEYKNIDIIKKVTDILKKDFKKNIVFIDDRPGHDFRYSISNNKLIKQKIIINTNFMYNLVETVNSLKKRF
tara:strand:- start:5029 stop:5916 length:888 start_codon:yes stop_codon:yes gene_type:complete